MLAFYISHLYVEKLLHELVLFINLVWNEMSQFLIFYTMDLKFDMGWRFFVSVIWRFPKLMWKMTWLISYISGFFSTLRWNLERLYFKIKSNSVSEWRSLLSNQCLQWISDQYNSINVLTFIYFLYMWHVLSNIISLHQAMLQKPKMFQALLQKYER